jgi:hypothetical protein
MSDVTGGQVKLVPGTTPDPNQAMGTLHTYNADGTPLDVAADMAPIVTGSAIGTVGKTTTAAEPGVNTIVAIKFTNGNSATSPTIAFNGGTARAMLLGGTASAAAKITLAAGGIALFFFDGTNLHQLGVYS